MNDDRTTGKTQRPYLLRAMHEWMIDSGLTPHIVVDASTGDVNVAVEHVKDGKLVLNVSYSATRRLAITNERVEFEARFGGTPRWIEIPITLVLGIYARETGQGMIFSSEQEVARATVPAAADRDLGRAEATDPRRTADRSFLKVVK